MIEITYVRKPNDGKLAIVVKGHAGNDTVCAAASMLAYTTAASLEQWEDGIIESKSVKLDSGDAVIAVSFAAENAEGMLIEFDTVAAGFDLLAGNFPDRVKIEVADK